MLDSYEQRLTATELKLKSKDLDIKDAERRLGQMRREKDKLRSDLGMLVAMKREIKRLVAQR